MTRYKEYLRSAGFRLENDYPYMPYDSIETVNTYFDTKLNYIVVETYHVSAGWQRLLVGKYGELVDWETAEVTLKEDWQASR